MFVSMALSRVVNAENELHEIIFMAENLSMPFMFSMMPDKNDLSKYNNELILNILGEPDPNLLTKA